jgi:hypothetical protein
MSNPTDNTTPVDETKFTPEQTLELAKVRNEAAAVQLELAKLEERGREAEAAHAKFMQNQAHKDAITASGVKFYEDGLASKLAEGYDIRYGSDGEATGVVDGKRVSLDRVYQAIALKHPTIADGRSTRGLKGETAEKPIRARSELTQAEKIALLHNPGGAALWDKMPSFPTRNVPIDELTRADFSRLTVAQRSRISAEKGASFGSWLAALPKEPRKF